MTAVQKLRRNLTEVGPLCVGLDLEPERVPAAWRADPACFLVDIVEATADLASAYKINTAFFESLGRDGYRTLERVRAAIPERSLLIWDGKRGDIGNTNRHYAQSAFRVWGADAVTVHPYLGVDSLRPFFEHLDRLTFVLCATSEGSELQELERGGEPVYVWVARQVQQLARERYPGACGLVVGATHPDRLERVRELAPELPLLVPGVGAQGGRVPSQPALINASRSILYAAPDDADPVRAARRAAESLLTACRSSVREAEVAE